MFKNSFGDEGCIVIGGPPCQAYSMAGRGKLRSLGEDRVNIKMQEDICIRIFEICIRIGSKSCCDGECSGINKFWR